MLVDDDLESEAMTRVEVGVSAPQYRGCQKVGMADPTLADGDVCAVLCNPISAVRVDQCHYLLRHAIGILFAGTISAPEMLF